MVTVNGDDFRVAVPLPHPFWSRVSDGSWEPETFKVLEYFLRPDWRFVDVGAWVGATSLFAAKKCGAVEAYECDPVALHRLKNNISANPDTKGKIRLHEHAIGDADGFLRLYSRALGNSETSIYNRHERKGSVVDCGETVLTGVRDARTVFREQGYAGCDRTLVKIDMEGAEFIILPHLAEVIAESRNVWLISFHEKNINPANLPVRFARISEMLRSLSVFATFKWHDENLKPLEPEAVLGAVVQGKWPRHKSFVFCRREIV